MEQRDRSAIVVSLILLVLLWSPTSRERDISGTLILAGLILLGVEVLRRMTIRELPDERRRARTRPTP